MGLLSAACAYLFLTHCVQSITLDKINGLSYVGIPKHYACEAAVRCTADNWCYVGFIVHCDPNNVLASDIGCFYSSLDR